MVSTKALFSLGHRRPMQHHTLLSVAATNPRIMKAAGLGTFHITPHIIRHLLIQRLIQPLMEDDNWQAIIAEAMDLEAQDLMAAHRSYRSSEQAAMAEVQAWIDHNEESASVVEALYGAFAGYMGEVMTRLGLEDPEHGGIEHAFRVGQTYGVSCVLNHLIDTLVDSTGSSNLGALDAWSDDLHEEIINSIRGAGLAIELLDAKGNMI